MASRIRDSRAAPEGDTPWPRAMAASMEALGKPAGRIDVSLIADEGAEWGLACQTIYLFSPCLLLMPAADSPLDLVHILKKYVKWGNWIATRLCVHLEAAETSFAKTVRLLFLFASTTPLSCLIFDQRLWPD